MTRTTGRIRPVLRTTLRDDPRFAIGLVLVLGSLTVMVFHVIAVVGRLLLRPEGVLADVFALLDAGKEHSLAAWWTAAMLMAATLCAALVAGLASASSERRREPLAWTVLAVVFAILSLDEIVSLHERGALWTLAVLDSASPFVHLGWLIPASAILIASLAFLVPTFRALPRRPRTLIVIGLATSVVGAMGLELVNVLLRNAGAELRWRHIVMAAEEATEMTGLLIVLAGISMAIAVEPAEDGGRTLRYRRS